MALQDDIREDLRIEVFEAFGKTITFIKESTPIYNEWGDKEDATHANTNILSAPYDIFWDRRSQQPFGSLKDGEMALAVPWDTVVAKEDIFLIESDYWKVTSVSPNWLPDNVVTILVLERDREYTP